MTNGQRIRDYINFRYQNWLDYATYQARLHGFEGWEGDLLNDTIINILEKDETKIIRMLNRTTRKIVNGQPTTELDKFVLRIMKINAWSKVAPFSKNTLGKKVLSRKSGEVCVVQKETVDAAPDTAEPAYDDEADANIERMHHRNIRRLKQNGFGRESIEYYQEHFIEGQTTEHLKAREYETVERIRYFLIETPKTILEL